MRAFFGALCVFLALLASPTIAESPWTLTILPVAAGDAEPASVRHPSPRTKPDRTRAATLPEGVSIVRQCAASTMMAKTVAGSEGRGFYARYSQTAFDEMVAEGCTMIQQGCNSCRVRYTDCTEDQRAACTDGACLEKICTRHVVCTTKACTAYSDSAVAPPCKARFARHACLASAFDAPLDKRAAPRE